MALKRTILILGATGSLGRAVTAAILKRQMKVALAGRNVTKLKELNVKNADGTAAECFQLDLCQQESIVKCSKDMKTLTGLSGVINCAAGFYKGDFKSMSQGAISNLIAVNFSGITLLMNALVPLLERNAPSDIVNIASISSTTSLDTSKSSALHIATKAALHKLDIVLGRELAASQIRVTTVAPSTFAKTDRPGIPVSDVADLIVQILEIPSSIRIETLDISPNA